MRVRIFLLISALALFFDQITKLSAQRLLVPYQIKPVIGNLVRITLVYNPRGLFGLPIGSGLSYYILPLVGVAIVIYFATRTKSFLYLCSYALILGGAIGNLWDRIRLGKVIDFIDIGVKNIRWYTFNLADMFIVIGIVMLIATEIFHPRPATEKVEEKDTAKDNQTN